MEYGHEVSLCIFSDLKTFIGTSEYLLGICAGKPDRAGSSSGILAEGKGKDIFQSIFGCQ
jgi:hypothetical protein